MNRMSTRSFSPDPCQLSSSSRDPLYSLPRELRAFRQAGAKTAPAPLQNELQNGTLFETLSGSDFQLFWAPFWGPKPTPKPTVSPFSFKNVQSLELLPAKHQSVRSPSQDHQVSNKILSKTRSKTGPRIGPLSGSIFSRFWTPKRDPKSLGA